MAEINENDYICIDTRVFDRCIQRKDGFIRRYDKIVTDYNKIIEDITSDDVANMAKAVLKGYKKEVVQIPE